MYIVAKARCQQRPSAGTAPGTLDDPQSTPNLNHATSQPCLPPCFQLVERLRLEEEERQRLAELERQRLELLGAFLDAEKQRLDAELYVISMEGGGVISMEGGGITNLVMLLGRRNRPDMHSLARF